jgi:hypothetical protein
MSKATRSRQMASARERCSRRARSCLVISLTCSLPSLLRLADAVDSIEQVLCVKQGIAGQLDAEVHYHEVQRETRLPWSQRNPHKPAGVGDDSA